MLNSAPDLSASRWAPHNRGQTSSPYHSNPLAPNHSHSHHGTNTTPDRRTSPTKALSTSSIRTSPARRQDPSPAQQRRHALTLYTRLFLRLKWRGSLLLTAHVFALDPTTHGIGLSPIDSDTQFRIDFFEFYVLLERTLLHLLNAVGVRVSATYNPATDASSKPYAATSIADVSASQQQLLLPPLHYAKPNPPISTPGQPTLIGDSKNLIHKHAFHQNLLAALSTPDNNPLYQLLGTGQVREYIGLAKDLRNGWKDSTSNSMPTTNSLSAAAGDSHENGGLAVAEAQQRMLEERLRRRYAETLKELRLDEMLRVVLGAVEEAGAVAEERLASLVIEEEEEAMRMGGKGMNAEGWNGRRVSVDMKDAIAGEGWGDRMRRDGERPWESMGLGAGWEGDEMEFD